MNCWHCNAELIWGGDEDMLDEEEWAMVTNFSCPTCTALTLVYLPNDHEDHFIMENTNG